MAHTDNNINVFDVDKIEFVDRYHNGTMWLSIDVGGVLIYLFPSGDYSDMIDKMQDAMRDYLGEVHG